MRLYNENPCCICSRDFLQQKIKSNGKQGGQIVFAFLRGKQKQQPNDDQIADIQILWQKFAQKAKWVILQRYTGGRIGIFWRCGFVLRFRLRWRRGRRRRCRGYSFTRCLYSSKRRKC